MSWHLQVQHVALTREADAAALLCLLDHYARDPMGGGQPLSAYARAHLVDGLRARHDYLGLLAYADDGHGNERQAVGLLNAFEGYSTFAAKPLLNIHDLVVLGSVRGQGIARQLLSALEDEARARGCCKLTLEVLSKNQLARSVYQRFGFAAYELAEEAGQALFLEKKLLPTAALP